MEFEGNLTLERPPSRRWVPVVAVVVPVAAFVLMAAWFIRAYVAPLMAAIPAPMELAAIPSNAPARSAKIAPSAPALAAPDLAAAAAPATAAKPEAPLSMAPVQAAPMPVFASLAAAPPTLNTTEQPAAAFADPSPDNPKRSLETNAMAPALDSSEPITGPIPLPPMRPRLMVAQVTGVVPLPRSRPSDASPAPEPVDSPAIYRHAVE